MTPPPRDDDEAVPHRLSDSQGLKHKAHMYVTPKPSSAKP